MRVSLFQLVKECFPLHLWVVRFAFFEDRLVVNVHPPRIRVIEVLFPLLVLLHDKDLFEFVGVVTLEAKSNLENFVLPEGAKIAGVLCCETKLMLTCSTRQNEKNFFHVNKY